MSKLRCECGTDTRESIENYYAEIDGKIYKIEDVPQHICDNCQVLFTNNTYVNLIENAIKSTNTAVSK